MRESPKLGQPFIAQAPLIIVAVSGIRRSAQRYGAREVRFYSIIGGALVVMLILLVVVDESLGTGCVAAFHDREAQQVLGLPPDVRPIMILTIGCCAEGSRGLARRSKARTVHHDRYRK